MSDTLPLVSKTQKDLLKIDLGPCGSESGNVPGRIKLY